MGEVQSYFQIVKEHSINAIAPDNKEYGTLHPIQQKAPFYYFYSA